MLTWNFIFMVPWGWIAVTLSPWALVPSSGNIFISSTGNQGGSWQRNDLCLPSAPVWLLYKHMQTQLLPIRSKSRSLKRLILAPLIFPSPLINIFSQTGWSIDGFTGINLILIANRETLLLLRWMRDGTCLDLNLSSQNDAIYIKSSRRNLFWKACCFSSCFQSHQASFKYNERQWNALSVFMFHFSSRLKFSFG